ncbi:hypothetical protein ACFQJC_00140 [Haloferax namakaokahaiae]|uniref:Uncharacterized protein n=1 Tax=Haloferax namakaokahaiae TaxID=1748331 RepID=A0ABD5ZAE4_9EURY
MSDASARLVEVFRDFGGEALRDVWVFDQRTHESHYVRDDVAAALDSVDVSRFIDNERYGYVTRHTYEALYYAEYSYTVRGFDSFEQFRTFVGPHSIGVLAGFDRSDEGRDFARLDDAVQRLGDELDFSRLLPTVVDSTSDGL